MASISDHGGEFQNESFESLCEENGIHHKFFTPRIAQKNGVLERKNRSLKKVQEPFSMKQGYQSTFGLMLYILFATH